MIKKKKNEDIAISNTGLAVILPQYEDVLFFWHFWGIFGPKSRDFHPQKNTKMGIFRF